MSEPTTTTQPRRPPLRPEPHVGNEGTSLPPLSRESHSQPRDEPRLTVLRSHYLIWVRKNGSLVSPWPDRSADTLTEARAIGEAKARIHELQLKFLDSHSPFEDTSSDGVFICEEVRDMSRSGTPIVR